MRFSASVCVLIVLPMCCLCIWLYACLSVNRNIPRSDGGSPIRAAQQYKGWELFWVTQSSASHYITVSLPSSTLTPLVASLWATQTPLWTVIGSLSSSLSQVWPSFQVWLLTDWLERTSRRHARRAFNWPQGVADWPGCLALWEHVAAGCNLTLVVYG